MMTEGFLRHSFLERLDRHRVDLLVARSVAHAIAIRIDKQVLDDLT